MTTRDPSGPPAAGATPPGQSAAGPTPADLPPTARRILAAARDILDERSYAELTITAISQVSSVNRWPVTLLVKVSSSAPQLSPPLVAASCAATART